MKRHLDLRLLSVVCMLALVLVLSPVARAEAAETDSFDISNMSVQQLESLRQQIDDELERRKEIENILSGANTLFPMGQSEDHSIDIADFCNTLKKMCIYVNSPWNLSSPQSYQVDGYGFTVTDSIRLIMQLSEQRIVKAAVMIDVKGNTENTLKMAALVAMLEAELYNDKILSDSASRAAMESAYTVLSAASESDNLPKVAASGIDGYSLPAVEGKVFTYYWEYYDGNVWLAVTLAPLPDDMY